MFSLLPVLLSPHCPFLDVSLFFPEEEGLFVQFGNQISDDSRYCRLYIQEALAFLFSGGGEQGVLRRETGMGSFLRVLTRRLSSA